MSSKTVNDAMLICVLIIFLVSLFILRSHYHNVYKRKYTDINRPLNTSEIFIDNTR